MTRLRGGSGVAKTQQTEKKSRPLAGFRLSLGLRRSNTSSTRPRRGGDQNFLKGI